MHKYTQIYTIICTKITNIQTKIYKYIEIFKNIHEYSQLYKNIQKYS